MIPALYDLPVGQILAFALVFLRAVAFVVAWPVFGSATVPVSLKVLLGLMFAMIFFPVVNFQNVDLITLEAQIVSLAFREIMIGLFLGFLMRMYFFAVSVAGEITSITIGLASAQQFNPAQGTTSNVVEQFQLMLATLFFLGFSGHHLFIEGFVKSFELAPVASLTFKTGGLVTLTETAQQVFVMGLKMAAPIMIAIFMANVAMGILGRAVPQINVLATSLAVQIGLGFVVMFIAMPLFVTEMDQLIQVMAAEFMKALRVI